MRAVTLGGWHSVCHPLLPPLLSLHEQQNKPKKKQGSSNRAVIYCNREFGNGAGQDRDGSYSATVLIPAIRRPPPGRPAAIIRLAYIQFGLLVTTQRWWTGPNRINIETSGTLPPPYSYSNTANKLSSVRHSKGAREAYTKTVMKKKWKWWWISRFVHINSAYTVPRFPAKSGIYQKSYWEKIAWTMCIRISLWSELGNAGRKIHLHL